MILRDLNLSLITLSKNKSDAECAEYWAFEFQSSCVCDLYCRCLPKLVTSGTAKVMIDLVDEDGWVAPANIQRLLNVTFSPWRANLADYWKLDEFGRKRWVLETLHAGLMWLAGIEGWATELLETAYRTCLERKLVNEFVSKKSHANPSKTASLKLFCEFGPHEAKLSAIVIRRRKELGRVFLASIVPSPYIVIVTMQSIAWVNDHVVSLQIQEDNRARPTQYEYDLLSVLAVAGEV